MKREQKKKLRKILMGLFKTQDEEAEAYFDSEINLPDEYGLVDSLAKEHGERPINQDEVENILFDCLRKLYPADSTDDVVEMKVREFIDYGFVERWNSGQYW